MKRRNLINKTEQDDEAMVLGATPTNQKITPTQIRMANAKYIILEDTSGNANAYFVRDGANNLIIANLLASGKLSLTATMASGNQRTVLFREYGSSDTLEIQHDFDITITSTNDNIVLNPNDYVKILTIPTTDPAVADAIWSDLGDLRISNGTAEKNTCFASIHNHDTTTAQSIPTGTTYTKITNFTDNGYSLNCTADASNDKITITEKGYYHVAGSFNFQCGTNNVVWRMAPFLGGVEFEEIHIKRKISTAGDVGSASFVGIVDATSTPVDLDVRARHGHGSSVNLTVEYANLTIHKISPT